MLGAGFGEFAFLFEIIEQPLEQQIDGNLPLAVFFIAVEPGVQTDLPELVFERPQFPNFGNCGSDPIRPGIEKVGIAWQTEQSIVGRVDAGDFALVAFVVEHKEPHRARPQSRSGAKTGVNRRLDILQRMILSAVEEFRIRPP